MSIFNKLPNADAAAINLLKQLRVKINPQDVVAELEKHPDYPSLLAISDVLNWFKIKNDAYRVNADDLAEVPVPYIAHTHINDDFVTVNKIDGSKVVLSDDKRGSYTLTFDEFKKRFKGVVLTAEARFASDDAITQSLADRLSPYKTSAAVVMMGIALILTLVNCSTVFTNISWQTFALILFKTAGLIASILLLVQSIDKNNPLIQTLCGGGGKANCNAILTSKAATVFKGLTWSEVGFFYFAGTWLALLFGGNSLPTLQALAVLNVISLPYTIYSINYQARIAKQWCVLCITVQVLLWLEFVPLVTYLKAPFVLLNAGSALIICLLLPVVMWVLLKPLLLQSQQLKTLKNQLRKFKYNQELFKNTLKTQPKYALPDDDWSIVLGNVEANTIITMVSNPYCPPCSKTHQELDEWLTRLDDIQLRIVFTATNDKNDNKTPVTRHLMALNDQADKTVIKQALHDWYEQKQKNYDTWARAYPVNLDQTKFNILEKQRAWCDMAEIKATPTLLVNGYRLPEAYRLQDIKYMLG